jgi:hypothetical protein
MAEDESARQTGSPIPYKTKVNYIGDLFLDCVMAFRLGSGNPFVSDKSKWPCTHQHRCVKNVNTDVFGKGCSSNGSSKGSNLW